MTNAPATNIGKMQAANTRVLNAHAAAMRVQNECAAATPSRRPTFAQLSQARENNFDFLRFFMAFVVIYTHAFALSGTPPSGWRQRLRSGDFGGAWIAVDFFFVISGFLITQSYLNSHGAWDYWKKRILRIYPGFTAALIFCVFIVGPLAGVSLHDYFTNPQTYAYFQALILRETTRPLPGVFTNLPFTGMVNGSLWTIRFELLCYALVFVLGIASLLRYRALVLGLLLLSLGTIAAETFSIPNHEIWLRLGGVPYFGTVYELPRFIYCFLAGMVFFLYRDKIPFSTGLLIASLIALLMAMVDARTFSLALPLFGTYILFHVAFNRRIPLKNFGRYGDFSYGLYLYAFPIEQLIVLHSGVTIRPWPLLALSFLITMVIAVLSWHLLEHPFLRLKGTRARSVTAGNPLALSDTAPLRVILLTDADVFAGTERHILSLACALRQEKIDVRIGCPVPSPLADHAAEQAIPVVAIPKRGRIDWQAAAALRGLLKSGQVQLIHAHNGRTALAAAIAMRGMSAKRLIVSQHFLAPAHTRRRGAAAIFSRIIHRWIDARAGRYIAVSQAVADAMLLREGFPAARIAVVHNGLTEAPPQNLRDSAKEVRDELNIDPAAPLIVCAARLEPEKDIGSLIAAMRVVCDRFPAARCIIAGQGRQQGDLADQIQRTNLQGNVHLLGFRDDVLSLINAGECFVLPSLAEPFGLVLLEAMALCRPVVATRVAGPLEIVEAGVTGLLVALSDPAALAAAVISLLADPPAAAAMGARGRQRFESLFTDRRMAAATAAVYRNQMQARA